MRAPNDRLPVRVAHPPRPQLEHLDDTYLGFLAECGYEGLYLQDSPFDSLTGNHGAFKKTFHLIYLYELSRGPERQRYVDYVNEVCSRAARHGLKAHLCCWEPRLPLAAWADTPPSWRGHGGFAYAGRCNLTSFCWSEPKAVAYWRQMALDAFAALPAIAGVHLGVADNEASFCDASCPKCLGKTSGQQLEDIYATLAEVKRGRPDFRIAIYDWWLPSELLGRLPAIVGKDALIIGRSSQGHSQEPMPGQVEDMTAVFDGCGPSIVGKKKTASRLGLRLVDMPAWSHPNESWMLPPPPDPRYAIEKLNSLHELGAAGWYDFDCGSTEPGSISEAIRVWTREPALTPAAMVERVVHGIFGDDAPAALQAYERFREGKREFPIAYHDPVVSGFSGRSLGLSLLLFGPFRPGDLRLMDMRHMFNWFAPFNLVTASTLPVVLPRLERMAERYREAFEAIAAVPSRTPRSAWERDVFEIHYRSARAIRNYFRLGHAKRDLLEGGSSQADFDRRARGVAEDEAANLDATEAWAARNPGCFFNPCHNLLGTLEESWPKDDFRSDLFAAKRRSLDVLLGKAMPPTSTVTTDLKAPSPKS